MLYKNLKEFISEFNTLFNSEIVISKDMITDGLNITVDLDMEQKITFDYGHYVNDINYNGFVNKCNIDCKEDKIEFSLQDCNGRNRAYLYSIHKISLNDVN